jgi:hypothetical protein
MLVNTRRGKQPEGPDQDERAQIGERLRWTPAQRLSYLKDMLAFERRAQRARRLHR